MVVFLFWSFLKNYRTKGQIFVRKGLADAGILPLTSILICLNTELFVNK